MNPGDELDDLLLTSSDIAELAGVRPSAVSNWRRRHADFPGEVETGRFRRGDVIAWLQRRGTLSVRFKTPPPPRQQQLLSAVADVLRDAGLGDIGDELLLQVLVLRAYGARTINPAGADLIGVWRDIYQERRGLNALIDGWNPVASIAKTRELVAGATTDPDLRAALVPSGRFDGDAAQAWNRLVSLVASLGDSSDWFAIAAQIVERFADAGRQSGPNSGEALTALMLAAISPVTGRILDPAAGASTVLGSIARANPDAVVHLYGQEVMERSWRLGFLSLLLQPVPFTLEVGDTLAFDRFRRLLADRIVAEPPFGMKVRPHELANHDERWTLEQPRPGTSSEALWVQHVLHHLAPGGLAAITLPAVLLESRRSSQRALVEGLVDGDHIDMVIDLPPSMLSGTDIRGVLLVLRKAPSVRTGEVVFVDLRQAGQMERKARRSLDSAEVEQFGSMVAKWRSGGDPTLPGYCKVVASREIARDGYDLSPRRRIDYSAAADARRSSLAPLLESHRAQLSRAMAHLDELGAGLRHQMGALSAAPTPAARTRHRLGHLLTAEITSGIRPALTTTGSDPDIPLLDPKLKVSAQRFIRGDIVDRTNVEIVEADLGEVIVPASDRRAVRGDLLITRRAGPDGEVSGSVVNVDEPVVFAESLLLLRPDPTIVDAHFLRIYLTTKPGAAALTAASSGTTLMLLDRTALLDVEVDLPPLAAQREIAEAVRSIERSNHLLRQLERAVTDVEQIAKELGAAGLLRTNQ